uniref:4-hydroxy-7-methoxy-3-oxo-3,4-dihydro-2H-1,4-benzoxazin-2-yl glucosidebeta-D-glucosidase n=1 Tax=Oryza brachyantha TaxID=4533 RepID=J3L562_ORYBR
MISLRRNNHGRKIAGRAARAPQLLCLSSLPPPLMEGARAAAAFLCVLLLFLLAAQDAALGGDDYARGDFPRDFVFGAATSAYQYEGAVAEGGRSPSIWDTFAHAGKMTDKSTGDIAADGYHMYKGDIKLMAETGLEAYRLSISWSRLIANGRGAVNQQGLKYYNNVIDELAKRGIQAHVMLYDLDLPQALEDEYDGWLSPRIVEDFTAYADVCFREFGDRVSHWSTLAEVNIGALGSYDKGVFPPGRCSDPFGRTKCTVGNSTVEPYVAVHNMLLAHATAVRLYREKYQALQKGMVGINMLSLWSYPLTNSTADVHAAQRYKDFNYGWVLNPLVFGDYPQVMKEIVGSRLPSFTQAQTELVKGAIDFFGINHYYSIYANDLPLADGVRDYVADISVGYRAHKTDTQTDENDPTKFPCDPLGLQLTLEYLRGSYGDYPIYIAENGKGSSNDSLDDTDRVDYMKGYIGAILDAIRNGVDVRGYFAWSFVDLFELLAGYQTRYGLYRVDFDDDAPPRRARRSARWYSEFLRSKRGSREPVLIARQ